MAPKLASERLPWHDVIEHGRGEQLVREARYGARAAEVGPLPDDLHPQLTEALLRTGVDRLYSHQSEALAAAR